MADENQSTPVATERVVLRKVDNRTQTDQPNLERWEVLGTVVAKDKTAAIKALAKDEPGEYRAPSLRAWKGGLEISIPEKPTPETKVFD